MKLSNKFTFIDLFAGVGGFHLAVKSVLPNAQCVFSSEIDKSAAETYRINHSIDPLNDITITDIESLPSVDLVCAGFPCQPFSRNGKYYNLNKRTISDDEKRANLFWYVIQYLKYHKPRFCLLENVKGLLRIKDTKGVFYKDKIIEALNELGYTGHCGVLDSADYGLAQQRKRVFFVCFRESSDTENFQWPEKESRVVAVEDIIDAEVDPRYFLDNLWQNRKNHKLPGSRLDALKESFKQRGKIVSSKTGKITPVAMIYGDTPSGAPRQQDKLYSVKGISPTIATFELSIPSFDANPWRVLTPRECARLQGFPDSFILPDQEAKAYKQMGNAISVPVIRKIIEKMRL